MTNPSTPIRHIVLITLKPEVSDEGKREVFTKLRKLGQQAPGLLEWRIEESLDSRKGCVLIENALFENQTAFERFQTSDIHRSTGEFLKDRADWIVANYLE